MPASPFSRVRSKAHQTQGEKPLPPPVSLQRLLVTKINIVPAVEKKRSSIINRAMKGRFGAKRQYICNWHSTQIKKLVIHSPSLKSSRFFYVLSEGYKPPED